MQQTPNSAPGNGLSAGGGAPATGFGDRLNSLGGAITLGDLLQKISMKSFDEIKLTVEAFPAQSPELRAEKLHNTVNKAKKRFAQLYAILIWLNEEHVQKYLQSTTDLKIDVNDQIERLNTKQDALYFLHSSLYGKRVKSLEVGAAHDILLNGCYTKLPSSIVHCRAPPPPPQVDQEVIIKQLETLIRAKLFLGEQLPVSYSNVSIENGVLKLTLAHYYELVLSLAHLKDHEAPWFVIGVKILTHNHERERLMGDPDPRDLNSGVLKVLSKIASLSNCNNPLFQMHRVCLYSAQSHSLRFLYVQALDMTRTSLIGIAEAAYVESPDRVAFRCSFWKVKVSEATDSLQTADVLGDTTENDSEYLYELTVSLMRPKHQPNAFLQSELLFEVKEVSSQASLFRDDDLSSTCETFSIPNGAQYIEEGVSFGALYHSTITLCSCRQLTSLFSLIKKTPLVRNAISCGLRLSGPEHTARISLTLESVEVAICVNAKDGTFVVCPSYLATVLGGETSQACEALQVEINERYRTDSAADAAAEVIATQELRGSWEESKGDHIQQSSSNGELVNLSPVLQLIFLSVAAQHTHAQLGIAPQQLPQSRNTLSICFPLLAWSDGCHLSCSSGDDSCDGPTTKKRRPLPVKRPQFCQLEILLEIRLELMTLEPQFFFCLCGSASCSPLRMETNHFVSQLQSLSPVLPRQVLSTTRLSSAAAAVSDWKSLPLEEMLLEIRELTLWQILSHFSRQFAFLAPLRDALSTSPSPGEIIFHSMSLPTERAQLQILLSYSASYFILAPADSPQQLSEDVLHSLLETLSQNAKLVLFQNPSHRLTVAMLPASETVCFISESRLPQRPSLVGLPLMHLSHFLSHRDSLTHWRASHHPSPLSATAPLSPEAHVSMTFVPRCFSLLPLQPPIIPSPLSLFSLDFSPSLLELIGEACLPLFSRFTSAAIGLAIQEISSPATLSPDQYLSKVSQAAAPLVVFCSALLRYLTTPPMAWALQEFTLWSLDYAVFEIQTEAKLQSLAVQVSGMESSTGMRYLCSLKDQTREAALEDIPTSVKELLQSAERT